MTRSAWTRCRLEPENSPAGVAIFQVAITWKGGFNRPGSPARQHAAPPRHGATNSATPAQPSGFHHGRFILFPPAPLPPCPEGKSGACAGVAIFQVAMTWKGGFKPPRSPARQHAAPPRHGATNSATPAQPSGIHHGRFILFSPALLPPSPEGESGACVCYLGPVAEPFAVATQPEEKTSQFSQPSARHAPERITLFAFSNSPLQMNTSRLRSFLGAAVLSTIGLLAKSEALTFHQLQEGAAVMATMKSETQLTPQQRECAIALSNYAEAFFAVTFQAQILSPENKPNPLYQPQEWMDDPKKVAASILNFLIRHKPETIENGESVSAGKVFVAWYLYNCKNRDGSAFLVIFTSLRGAFGSDYPGADALLKEAKEAAALDAAPKLIPPNQ